MRNPAFILSLKELAAEYNTIGQALFEQANATEKRINLLRDRMKQQNAEDVANGIYSYVSGTLYMDIVCECERLADYVMNVVEARYGK